MRRGTEQRVPDPIFGLITIVVLVLASWLLTFGSIPGTGGFQIDAVLRNAPEVQTGSKVRIAGVNVGKVMTTRRGPGNLATITMELEDSALPLHRDATLKVRPRTFLEGGFFVDLKPGTPGTPELKDGGTIPVSSTASAVLLGHAAADLRFATRQNLRHLFHSLRQAFDTGGAEALRDTQPHVAPAFRSLAQVAEAARGERPGDATGAVRATGRVAAAVSANDERLADLITGLNRTVRALGSRREQLARSVTELDGLLAETHPALAELNALFPSARAFAREVRPGVRQLPSTLRLALPFLDQAQGLLGPRELPALLRQLEPAVRDLARLEPPLAKVLELVTPVTECLRRNAVPALKTPLEDPPHSTGEPVYRDLLHALPGLASATQNFDGNGMAVRYHAGFGEQTVSTQLPGTGEPFLGTTSQPLIGSRPRFTNDPPPFRPDVKCVTQAPANLRAQTGPAPQQSSVPKSALRRGLRDLQELIEERRR